MDWPVNTLRLGGTPEAADHVRAADLRVSAEASPPYDLGTCRRGCTRQLVTDRDVADCRRAHSAASQLRQLALAGVDPETATMTLATYGEAIMNLALRGLEGKTLDPYLAGWRKGAMPALGHVPVRMITHGGGAGRA